MGQFANWFIPTQRISSFPPTNHSHNVQTSFFNMGQHRPLFHLYLVFSNKQCTCTRNQCEKITNQFTVLGVEPKTFWTWVSSLNHSTRAPAQWSNIVTIPMITRLTKNIEWYSNFWGRNEGEHTDHLTTSLLKYVCGRIQRHWEISFATTWCLLRVGSIKTIYLVPSYNIDWRQSSFTDNYSLW